MITSTMKERTIDAMRSIYEMEKQGWAVRQIVPLVNSNYRSVSVTEEVIVVFEREAEGWTRFNTTTKMETINKTQCIDCGRIFDLMNEEEANEWYYGHDCEV